MSVKDGLPIVDRIAGWLLAIGALLHGYGSYLAYPSLGGNLVWAWSGSVAALLLAAINLLRVNRPNDRPLPWISFVGCLLWIGIVGAFAATLPDPIDLRPLYHLGVTLILAALSLRMALRPATLIAGLRPIQDVAQCPLMALSGHHSLHRTRLLSG